MAEQYLRRASLTVESSSERIDLSEMQFSFDVTNWDVQTPNAAVIRVYNLSKTTAQKIGSKEFTKVTLQAGYQSGSFGVVFDGQIKQGRYGKINATDTYFDIRANDGDSGYNYAVLNRTLSADQSSPQDQLDAHLTALKSFGVTKGYSADLPKNKLARGKVLYGMARDGLRDLMSGFGYTWSIQSGKLNVIPLDGFLPTSAVVCNASTGMIGIPEQTTDGVVVRMLLNPLLAPGSKLQINQGSINLAAQGLEANALPIEEQIPGLGYGDGVYRIQSINHYGDTRGNDWYSEVQCLSIDPTVNHGLTPGLLSKGTLIG